MRLLLFLAAVSLSACGQKNIERESYSDYVPTRSPVLAAMESVDRPEPQPIPAGVSCDEIVIKDHRIRDEVASLDEEAIRLERPLIEGGRIVCVVDSVFGADREYKISRYETGKYNGMLYRFYYADGSGLVQGDPSSTLDTIKDLRLENWDMRCTIDRIGDSKSCSLSKGHLTVGIWKDGSTLAWVGSNHYPGTAMTVRVDRGRPISAGERSGFSSSQAATIVSQLKSGQSAITRYQEWPYRSNLDEDVDLFGFSQAWELLGIIYRNAAVY
tara:strand:+ start:1089 stop:1901 length:813 start_codon:yes stop_codon:yes gene_type:complete